MRASVARQVLAALAVADAHIPTRPTVELIATVDEQPTTGMRVLALQHGNCLVSAIWTTTAAKEYDAWCYLPKVPDKVKQIQADRLVSSNQDKKVA